MDSIAAQLPTSTQQQISQYGGIAVNAYLGIAGTAYDTQDTTANTAVQIATTLQLMALAAGPAAPFIDAAGVVAGMVGYGMELHDALKTHNKKMETEAILGLVLSIIPFGMDLKMMADSFKVSSKFAVKIAEMFPDFMKALQRESIMKSALESLDRYFTERIEKLIVDPLDKYITNLQKEIEALKKLPDDEFVLKYINDAYEGFGDLVLNIRDFDKDLAKALEETRVDFEKFYKEGTKLSEGVDEDVEKLWKEMELQNKLKRTAETMKNAFDRYVFVEIKNLEEKEGARIASSLKELHEPEQRFIKASVKIGLKVVNTVTSMPVVRMVSNLIDHKK